MKTLVTKLIVLVAIILAGSVELFSQPVYKVNPSKSKLVIEGTSSLHDWSMVAENFNCIVEFDLNNEKVNNISGITFSVPVKDIISDESNLMDKKAHDALKENKSPEITFKQQSLESLNSANGQVSGKVKGNLTIAGKTKPVTISFSGKVLNNTLQITGSMPINMSDFGIEPPTAMLGALKTGDAVTLNYSFEFNPNLTSNR